MKLTYTTVSPTFHVYPDRHKGAVVQITCAGIKQCIATVQSQKHYPAVIKDPNNEKEYYMDKNRNVTERTGS